jgi:OOP family OmpA-OmpF porin
MPKITPSFHWPLLTIVLAMSACKAKLPDTLASIALPISAATAAPVEAPSRPVQATQPPVPAAAAVPAGAFDINSIPMTQTPLPPFPYIDWPSALPTGGGRAEVEQFDRRYVITGHQARPVEGRIELREFNNNYAKLSTIGSQRNYENALKAIGAVRVDAVYPFDVPDTGMNRGQVLSTSEKFHFHPDGSYSAYLIRTPNKNVWFSLSVNNSYTKIMIIDEKSMTQSVGMIGQAPPAAR